MYSNTVVLIFYNQGKYIKMTSKERYHVRKTGEPVTLDFKQQTEIRIIVSWHLILKKWYYIWTPYSGIHNFFQKFWLKDSGFLASEFRNLQTGISGKPGYFGEMTRIETLLAPHMVVAFTDRHNHNTVRLKHSKCFNLRG